MRSVLHKIIVLLEVIRFFLITNFKLKFDHPLSWDTGWFYILQNPMQKTANINDKRQNIRIFAAKML